MIKVRYYGLPLHEGILPDEVVCREGLRPIDIIGEACAAKGKEPEMFSDLTYSVNGVLKDGDCLLRDGDELVMFFPTFGG